MSKLFTQDEIQNIFKNIFLSKNIPMEYFWKHVIFSNPVSDASPYIEIDEKGYHYVISERGKENERKTTLDVQDILYWIFEDITFSIASKVALYTKTTWEQRRVLFKVQLEWLRSINPDFEKRYLGEINKILKHAPFDDGLPNNMDWETWGDSLSAQNQTASTYNYNVSWR